MVRFCDSDDSEDAMVGVELVADDVMVDVSFELELEMVLDSVFEVDDDSDVGWLDVEVELSLGVTPAGIVSAGRVGLGILVDSDTDIDDVIAATSEVTAAVRASRALVASPFVAAALLEEPVPCRGTRTLKSAMPSTTGSRTLCCCSSSCGKSVLAGARDEYVCCNKVTPWECDGWVSVGAVLLSSLKSGSARELDSFRRLKGGAMASSIRHPLHPQLGSFRPARRFGGYSFDGVNCV